MRWQVHYLINIILRSSPLLIAWILDLIAFTTPLVDLTEVVDKGLATGWSAAGLAKYTVGLWWNGIPEKVYVLIWFKIYKNKQRTKILQWFFEGRPKKHSNGLSHGVPWLISIKD